MKTSKTWRVGKFMAQSMRICAYWSLRLKFSSKVHIYKYAFRNSSTPCKGIKTIIFRNSRFRNFQKIMGQARLELGPGPFQCSMVTLTPKCPGEIRWNLLIYPWLVLRRFVLFDNLIPLAGNEISSGPSWANFLNIFYFIIIVFKFKRISP